MALTIFPEYLRAWSARAVELTSDDRTFVPRAALLVRAPGDEASMWLVVMQTVGWATARLRGSEDDRQTFWSESLKAFAIFVLSLPASFAQSFAALFYGRGLALLAFALDMTVESTPPGRWSLERVERSTRAGLAHSIYEEPRALSLIADWIRRESAPPLSEPMAESDAIPSTVGDKKYAWMGKLDRAATMLAFALIYGAGLCIAGFGFHNALSYSSRLFDGLLSTCLGLFGVMIVVFGFLGWRLERRKHREDDRSRTTAAGK
jgi:hypothetical protein